MALTTFPLPGNCRERFLTSEDVYRLGHAHKAGQVEGLAASRRGVPFLVNAGAAKSWRSGRRTLTSSAQNPGRHKARRRPVSAAFAEPPPSLLPTACPGHRA